MAILLLFLVGEEVVEEGEEAEGINPEVVQGVEAVMIVEELLVAGEEAGKLK